MHKKQQRTASKSPSKHGAQKSPASKSPAPARHENVKNTAGGKKPHQNVVHKMPKFQKSITQEFFPRSAGVANPKTQGFTFNQAPIDKNAAKEQAKEKVLTSASKAGNKRSAFVARLYQDEEGIEGGANSKTKQYEDEMRVFDMDADDSDGEQPAASKKRDNKQDGKEDKPAKKQRSGEQIKIGKLKFSPGSLGLFAIAEVHPTYLIVNFTRNTKGFVSLADKGEDYHKGLDVGQLIVASVTTSGTSQFNTETSGLQNKKLQLVLSVESLNKSLIADNVVPGMVLQGEIVSKEAKGFILNFGLKDKTQGFLPIEQSTEHLLIGQTVTTLVKQVMSSSKIIKVEIASKIEGKPLVSKELTIHNIKPGFLVAAKVSRVMENGIELNFLGGFTGTVFVDHLDKDPSKYKHGDKLSARVITVDPMTQTITLSTLPHILKLENISSLLQTEGIAVGKLFEKVPVNSVTFGDSYRIGLTPSVAGFLHKIHAVKKVQEKKKKGGKDEVARDDEEDGDQVKYEKAELEKGQKVERVRVKEINYFDGCPILSMKEEIIGTAALNYDQISCGQYLSATIDEVNTENKYIVMRVNDFVKGRLYLEHMADLPLKVIPPKLAAVGKEIKVRVFSIDHKTRYIEFTKKDTLFKEKTPVYQSYKDANKGDKIVGVVVSQNEHGYIVRSFGGIKALLTFAEIKQHGEKHAKDLKAGSIVKAYVLFRKKDKGMALTLDKVKAKELRKENGKSKSSITEVEEGEEKVFTTLEQYFPTADQIAGLKDRYKSLIKISQDKSLIGKTFQFRVVETTDNYFICKSLDAEKKSKNVVATLPKALVSKFFIHALSLEDHVFEGLVIDLQDDALPIISSQGDLISLKDSIPSSPEDLTKDSADTFVGVVGNVDKRGVSVRFLNGLRKLVLVKDLETVQDFRSVYKVGKVVRASKNKLDRITLKAPVIYHKDREATLNADKDVQIKTLYRDLKPHHDFYELKIGEKVATHVTLAKDYGNIVSCDKYPTLTGFILNEHLIPKKEYKEGQKLSCVILDIDFEKEILDLSEKLADKAMSANPSSIKVGHQYKVVVELNKEDYLLVSFKQSKTSIGLLMMQNLNGDQVPNPNEKYQVGDEIDVKVVQVNEGSFILTVPVISKATEKKTKGSSAKADVSTLKQGQLVQGTVKSIKGQCAYLQLSNMNQLVIGRLHRLEAGSGSDFQSLSVGENIKAKILKVSQDKEKTWIELTKKREHLNKPGDQLDEAALAKTIFSLEDLKEGQQYDAVITDVNYAHSQPINVSISPFIKAQISFERIVDAETLIQEGASYLQKFQPGAAVKVYYFADGTFSLLKSAAKKNDKKFSKGDIAVVRLVKGVQGKGITVQLSQSQFGFIEMAEISDDLVGSLIDTFALIQPIFPARVIDLDKNQKLVLSARDSVVQPKSWELISPAGKSVHFQKFDEKNQQIGNQRNKILKFGADVALHEGDLCVGYITNIGKSGCFVQIGHNCTVRAGLNELSDSQTFNFTEQMPLGRLVLARIYKVDEKNGKKLFNITLRKSLVVYGVGAVDRDSLTPGAEVECTVQTLADDGAKAFAQITGSYLKLKVKELTPGQVSVGDNIRVSLQKVTKQKITATLLGKSPKVALDDSKRKIEKLWLSIEEESQKDIEATKARLAKGEVDEEKLKNLGPGAEEEEDEIARQMRDIQDLKRGGKDDDEMETVQDDDSDAEEMQRIIKESKTYGDDDDDEAEDEDMEDDEEGELEDDDEEMEDDEDEERFGESSEESEGETKTKGASGKQSLKARIKEEQSIRQKEKEMRAGTDQPTSVDDFERLVITNTDQSYVWIQYMAFMLDKLGADAARRIAERAVKGVSISNEDDKLNLWVAYMNLENNFGSQQTLEKVVKRALEVNDRKKIYLQLISMYQASQKYAFIEDIYKQLTKKFNNSLKVWTGYIEFLFTVKQLKKDRSAPAHVVVATLETAEPKTVLQRALQSLPKDKHVALISKFGMLEFKHGQPENGRTMFEGIVNNYPKRMDIWSVYMDMEVKYGGEKNQAQARHLFERCLTNQHIMKKPKKMKLVFQKYMEFEMNVGNKKNVEKLRERVEKYLESAFVPKQAAGSDSESD